MKKHGSSIVATWATGAGADPATSVSRFNEKRHLHMFSIVFVGSPTGTMSLKRLVVYYIIGFLGLPFAR